MNVLQTTPQSSYTPYNSKLSDALKMREILKGFGITTELCVQDDRVRQIVPYDNYYLDQTPEVMGYFILRPSVNENHVVSQLMVVLDKANSWESFVELWNKFQTGYRTPYEWYFSLQGATESTFDFLDKKFD